MKGLEFYKSALKAASEPYVSMHVLDLDADNWEVIKSNPMIDEWTEDCETIQEALSASMGHLIVPENQKLIQTFVDLRTLPARIEGRTMISQVACGHHQGWCNVRFIRMDEDGSLHHILMTVENVDEQTRELDAARESLEESQKLQTVVAALTDSYSTVFGLDLQSDKIELYKIYGRIHDMLGDALLNRPYTETISAYVDQAVFPEDRDEVTRVLKVDHIREQLRVTPSFTAVYRNNQGTYGEVKIVRTGEDSVLMGFVEKHAEITELNQQIFEDSLTKVCNRKFLDEKLVHMTCNGVVMADMDHFKQINDSAGHQGGDEALAAVGRALTSCVRSSDFVVRYGGDEFLVVFPNIPYDKMQERVEAMRLAVEKISLPHYPQLHLSMSFGAVFGTGFVGNMISEADQALYESKKKYGNHQRNDMSNIEENHIPRKCYHCGDKCLKHVDFLEGLPQEKLLKLVHLAKGGTLEKDELLFEEGGKVEGIFIIRQGRVKLCSYDVEGREQIITVFADGDTIWEGIMLENSKYPYHAVCLEPVQYCLITEKAMESVMEDPVIAMRVIKLLSKKLHRANQRNMLLAVTKPRARLAGLLLLRSRHAATDTVTLRLDEMAGSINLRPETISRKMKEMEREGAIEKIGQSTIRILDRDRLREIYRE